MKDESSTQDLGISGHAGSQGGGTAAVLLIAWAAEDPRLTGAVLVPPAGSPALGSFVVGRGAAREEDPSPRLVPARQRPGITEALGPIESPFLSRVQLVVQVRAGAGGAPSMEIENVGRCPMRRAGHPLSRAVLAPGDVIELKRQLVLLCVARPATLPLARNLGKAAPHAFGEPDAHGIVGEGPVAWALRDRLAFVARQRAHTLLLGPSGTGKELLARALHDGSPRAARRLVARNAATLPAGIVEAELFGNVRNYPNPGMPERRGLVGEADGGTLFLDEIGELPIELSTRLLRVLDEGGEYQRLGESTARTCDLRLIAATNRAVTELKHDLAARFPLRLATPGLNERPEDVPLLVRHLLRRAAASDAEIARRFASPSAASQEPRVTSELIEALLTHRYSTHVRELDGLLWRALASSPGGEVELTSELRKELGDAAPQAEEAVAEASDVDAAMIRAALARHGGVQERVWRELGLKNRYVLKRLMKKMGIAGDGADEDAG